MTIEDLHNIFCGITTSAAFIGGLGGLVKAFNNKLKLKELAIRVTCGSIIASVSGAHIAQSVREDLQPLVIFVIGYMGVEAVDFMVELGKEWIEKRIGKKKADIQ